MHSLISIDWKSLFVPSISIWEIVLRGTVVYLFLFILLRIMRRQAGTVGLSDLIVIVLIADASQNAMASEYKSITEGIVLVSTIISWDYFLNWLDYRFPSLRRVLRPAPLPLIKNGRLQRKNMKKEMITEEELMNKLREQGVGDLADVKESYLEGDGGVSVVKKQSKGDAGSQKKSQDRTSRH